MDINIQTGLFFFNYEIFSCQELRLGLISNTGWIELALVLVEGRKD